MSTNIPNLSPSRHIPKQSLFQRSTKTMATTGIPKHAITILHSSVEAKKLAEHKAAGLSCLSCPHTKKAYGGKLLCKLKDKLVSQYNICEMYGAKIK